MLAALGLGLGSERDKDACRPCCPPGKVPGGGCGGHRPGLRSHLLEGPASAAGL